MAKPPLKLVYRGFEIVEREGTFLVNGGIENGWKGHESLKQAKADIDVRMLKVRVGQKSGEAAGGGARRGNEDTSMRTISGHN